MPQTNQTDSRMWAAESNVGKVNVISGKKQLSKPRLFIKITGSSLAFPLLPHAAQIFEQSFCGQFVFEDIIIHTQ